MCLTALKTLLFEALIQVFKLSKPRALSPKNTLTLHDALLITITEGFLSMHCRNTFSLVIFYILAVIWHRLNSKESHRFSGRFLKDSPSLCLFVVMFSPSAVALFLFISSSFTCLYVCLTLSYWQQSTSYFTHFNIPALLSKGSCFSLNHFLFPHIISLATQKRAKFMCTIPLDYTNLAQYFVFLSVCL